MNPFVRNLSQQFNKSMQRLAGDSMRRKIYLVALSGGRDSMALCHLAHHSGLNIRAAHCNFELRGNESTDDEKNVINFCESLNIAVEVKRFDTKNLAESSGESIQVTARRLRYQWFEELAKQYNADYIMTAHHSDDNVETFFLNLARGGGLKGLKGIPGKNGRVIRPLLNMERSHLDTYCTVCKIPYREDSSNQDNKYKRNYLRNGLLPGIFEHFSGFKDNLLHSMDIIGQSESYISSKVQEQSDKCIIYNRYGSRLYLDHNDDKALMSFIVRAYLNTRGFSSSDIEDMNRALMVNKSGIKIISTDKSIAFSDRNKIIHIENMPKSSSAGFNLSEGRYETDMGFFEVIKVSDYGTDNFELLLPLDLQNRFITVRVRQDGDKITSLGMNGQKQKLQDIYTNAKLDHLQKLLQPVVVIDEMIIWIPGIKRSQYFVPDKNKESFLIKFQPADENVR